MLRLSRLLIEEGVEHLHLFLHSSSLLPGLAPYAPSGAAVERLYAAVARYVEALAKMTPLRFGTVPERSEEHTSELQSHSDLVCRLLLEKKKSQLRHRRPAH